MATVNALTAERTLEIEDAIITTATINGSGHLILTRNDGSTVDAGVAKGTNGAAGAAGAAGADGDDGVSGAISVTDLESVPGGTPAGTPIFLHA